jgi:hypothetical protein
MSKSLKDLELEKMRLEQRIDRLRFKEENAENLRKNEKKSIKIEKSEVNEKPREKKSLLQEIFE